MCEMHTLTHPGKQIPPSLKGCNSGEGARTAIPRGQRKGTADAVRAAATEAAGPPLCVQKTE